MSRTNFQSTPLPSVKYSGEVNATKCSEFSQDVVFFLETSSTAKAPNSTTSAIFNEFSSSGTPKSYAIPECRGPVINSYVEYVIVLHGFPEDESHKLSVSSGPRKMIAVGQLIAQSILGTVCQLRKVRSIALVVNRLDDRFLSGDALRALIIGINTNLAKNKLWKGSASYAKLHPVSANGSNTSDAESKSDSGTVFEFSFIFGKSDHNEELTKKLASTDLWTGARLFTRDLTDAPANCINSDSLRDIIGHEISGMHVKVIEEAELKSMGMDLLLAVGQAGSTPTRLFHITKAARGDDAHKKVVVLLGKCVTFDAGGMNLKTKWLEVMKIDKGGACAVLAVMRAIEKMEKMSQGSGFDNLEIHAVIPAVENMLGSKMYRTGDILTAANGKTVEIHNTDAEGRLCLADAMCYIESKVAADYFIDIATLTGANGIALGPSYGGAYSDNVQALDMAVCASKKVGELLWPMPVAGEYASNMNSKICDMRNIGKTIEGGAIKAALFLREFVTAEWWLHLDIAMPVMGEETCTTGYGALLLLGLLECIAGRAQ